MINFKDFQVSQDTAYNIMNAILYCKEHGEDGIVFEKNAVYHIKRERAMETVVSVSNHSHQGYRRAAFLLEGFENFTIDGNGCEFIMDDILSPFILSGCSNVTLKNFFISSVITLNAQAKVVATGAEMDGSCWSELELSTKSPYYVQGGTLYFGTGNREDENTAVMLINEHEANTSRLIEGTGDYSASAINFSILENGHVLAENVQFGLGNVVVLVTGTRLANGIFLRECVNTTICNIAMYSGIGMGIIAQNCDTIRIDHFDTRPRIEADPAKMRKYSINADSMHFVHCKGEIHVSNGYYEGQRDDALNVHSIYLQVVDKWEKTLILKYKHWEAKGIDILQPGDRIEALRPDTLLPYDTLEVVSVRRINLDCVEIQVDHEPEQVEIGDVVDEITWKPTVIFENCTICDNRARGMLIANRGTTIIQNNHFRTSGSAIQLECDGKYWFESGGIGHLIIENNLFEHCRYAKWGRAVIDVIPRESTEKGLYYHGTIEVHNNVFKDCDCTLAIMNNVKNVVWEKNHIDNCEGEILVTEHCGNVHTG